MDYRKIRDAKIKEENIKAKLECIKCFSNNNNLINVHSRCSKFLEYEKSGKLVKQKDLEKLKFDLYADILGPNFYDPDLKIIPPSDTIEYKIAYAVNLLDDHIFGEKQKKKTKRLYPLDTTPPVGYHEVFNKKDNNLTENLTYIKEKLDNGDISRCLVIMTLSTFRSLHHSMMEANKKWIQKMEKNIENKSEEFWEQLNTFDFLFVKQNHTDKNDFDIVASSFAHGAYRINKDFSVTILPGDDGYLRKDFTLSFSTILGMLYKQTFLHSVGIPALI